MPNEFIKKQTLFNCERFISEKLKEFETKVLTAENAIKELSENLFNQIINEIKKHTNEIISTAKQIAILDVLYSLSYCAINYDYIKPKIITKNHIKIKNSRHPIIERYLEENKFIANDVYLNEEDRSLIMLTGPNMAGKSTYIRQIALIIIMSQIGSFVPASSAEICIVDKLFTRIGACDDIKNGYSTFMVEMNETANILKNATKNSLIILDEVGRGTSTYDGISLAWAISEQLANKKIKTLFATHYHELTEMVKQFPQIKNYTISIEETSDNIIFLYKIIKGIAHKSYGIHVAKLSGIPKEVLIQATIMLKKLEQHKLKYIPMHLHEKNYIKDTLKEKIQNININNITPRQALEKLFEIQKLSFDDES